MSFSVFEIMIGFITSGLPSTLHINSEKDQVEKFPQAAKPRLNLRFIVTFDFFGREVAYAEGSIKGTPNTVSVRLHGFICRTDCRHGFRPDASGSGTIPMYPARRRRFD